MKRLLREYLVTVYSADNVRLGAFTLYGRTYSQVLEKATTRLNYWAGESLTMSYKGSAVLEEWEDEY